MDSEHNRASAIMKKITDCFQQTWIIPSKTLMNLIGGSQSFYIIEASIFSTQVMKDVEIYYYQHDIRLN